MPCLASQNDIMNNPLMMMNLLAAVYWFDEGLQEALRNAGWETVTRAQSLLFANIAVGEHRAIRLAENLGVSRQAISQMLRDLHDRGLVVVRDDPDDGRARIVNFSPASESLRNAARDALEALERQLEARIGGKDYRSLRAALLKNWGDPPRVQIQLAAPSQPSTGRPGDSGR
jgi:DNA-binding MarR family transcriptional regulator